MARQLIPRLAIELQLAGIEINIRFGVADDAVSLVVHQTPAIALFEREVDYTGHQDWTGLLLDLNAVQKERERHLL